MKLHLGEKEYDLLNRMKNIRQIEKNLQHGIGFISRKIIQQDLAQEDIAKLFSAGLIGQNEFKEPDEVLELMYKTKEATPIYWANMAVLYMDELFQTPEELDKKKEAQKPKQKKS